MEVKPTLLVSACLLGQPVRYDGQAKPLAEHAWTRLRREFTLLPACPDLGSERSNPRRVQREE